MLTDWKELVRENSTAFLIMRKREGIEERERSEDN